MPDKKVEAKADSKTDKGKSKDDKAKDEDHSKSKGKKDAKETGK